MQVAMYLLLYVSDFVWFVCVCAGICTIWQDKRIDKNFENVIKKANFGYIHLYKFTQI